jgi:hypothetical protein
MGPLSHASLVLRLINYRDNFNFAFTSNIKFRINLLGAFGDEVSKKMASHYLFMLCSTCPKEVRSASWSPLLSPPWTSGWSVVMWRLYGSVSKGEVPVRIADQDKPKPTFVAVGTRWGHSGRHFKGAAVRAKLMPKSRDFHIHRSRW